MSRGLGGKQTYVLSVLYDALRRQRRAVNEVRLANTVRLASLSRTMPRLIADQLVACARRSDGVWMWALTHKGYVYLTTRHPGLAEARPGFVSEWFDALADPEALWPRSGGNHTS